MQGTDRNTQIFSVLYVPDNRRDFVLSVCQSVNQSYL